MATQLAGRLASPVSPRGWGWGGGAPVYNISTDIWGQICTEIYTSFQVDRRGDAFVSYFFISWKETFVDSFFKGTNMWRLHSSSETLYGVFLKDFLDFGVHRVPRQYCWHTYVRYTPFPTPPSPLRSAISRSETLIILGTLLSLQYLLCIWYL